MTRSPLFLFLFLLLFIAAACSPAAQTASPDSIIVTGSAPTANAQSETLPTNKPAAASPAADQKLARSDSQASVEFVITPLNLTSPGQTLDFDLSMNTHSVDLSWDLAAQSVLSTDTGREVKGASWPVGSGHHYEGTLSFPSQTADGKLLLDGAKKLTLTIRDAATPERVFEWELSK